MGRNVDAAEEEAVKEVAAHIEDESSSMVRTRVGICRSATPMPRVWVNTFTRKRASPLKAIAKSVSMWFSKAVLCFSDIIE